MNFYNVGFNTGQAIGDFLYCSATKFNGLFKVNIYTGEMQFLGNFPEEDYSGRTLFRESYAYKNNIIFIPQLATGIVIYNVESEQFMRHELGEKVCVACLVESMLWIFPAFGKEKIWKLNLDTFELNKFDNLFGWKDINVQRVIFYNNSFWAANINTNIVIKIDRSSLEIKKIQLDCSKINTLSEAKNGLWIVLANNKEVVKWYPETGVLLKKQLDIVCDKKEQLYVDVIDTEGKTFIIPVAETPLLSGDEEEKLFKKASDFPTDFQILIKGIVPFFICRVYTKKGWCILPCNANYMIFIDNKENDINYISPYCNDLKLEQYIKEKYGASLRKRIINEYIDVTLSQYLELI